MALTPIATYISTTSSSELSSFYTVATHLTDDHEEFVIKESYKLVNERLDSFTNVPISKEWGTSDSFEYPSHVRQAQFLAAFYYIQQTLNASSEDTDKAFEAFEAFIQEIKDGKYHLEADYSPDELGIQKVVPGASNTSTASWLVDYRNLYSGSTGKTYTFTITTGGAVETAVYSWTDGEGNTTPDIKTSYDWTVIENGLSVRQIKAGQTFVEDDTFTVECIPYDTPKRDSGGLRTIKVSP